MMVVKPLMLLDDNKQPTGIVPPYLFTYPSSFKFN